MLLLLLLLEIAACGKLAFVSFCFFFFYLSLSFLVQNLSKRVRAFSRTSEASDRLDKGEAFGDEATAELPFGGDDGASRTL